jgi:hypothetical protein
MKLDHVRVRDCACPDTPHEGHFVFVTSTLSLEGGVEAEAALIAAITTAGKGPVDTKALEVLWRDIFVRHGVVGWDLCDEDGEPIPFSLEALREDFSIARPVLLHIENKDWGELVIAPFQTTPATPSRSGPTPATTSARAARTRKQSD